MPIPKSGTLHERTSHEREPLAALLLAATVSLHRMFASDQLDVWRSDSENVAYCNRADTTCCVKCLLTGLALLTGTQPTIQDHPSQTPMTYHEPRFQFSVSGRSSPSSRMGMNIDGNGQK